MRADAHVVGRELSRRRRARHGARVVAGDPESLARALAELLADADLRTELGANGERLALERFSWDALAPAYARLYREVALSRAAA